MNKAPEKLLGVAELVDLTGLHKSTVLQLFKTAWNVRGGAKMIRGEYRVTVSFYNRWVDSCDVALKQEVGHG